MAATRPIRQAGFTLMEVMATLVIVSVVLLSILAIRSRNLHDANRARNTRRAEIIAQRALEEALLGLESSEEDIPAGFGLGIQNAAPERTDARHSP